MKEEKLNLFPKVIPKTFSLSFISILILSIVIVSGRRVRRLVTNMHCVYNLFTCDFKAANSFKVLAETIFFPKIVKSCPEVKF